MLQSSYNIIHHILVCTEMECVKHLLYNFFYFFFFCVCFFFSRKSTVFTIPVLTHTQYSRESNLSHLFFSTKNPQIFKDTLILDMGVRSITTQDCLLIIIYLYKFLLYDLWHFSVNQQKERKRRRNERRWECWYVSSWLA